MVKKEDERLYEIGRCLVDERNFEEAYDYFLEAAHMKNVKAIKSLALLYLYGAGVQQSFEKAFRYLQVAFDLSGRVWGAYEVADNRSEITGCDEGRTAYRDYLDYLVDRDVREAFIYKAHELLEALVYQRDVEGAIRLFEKAFEYGDDYGVEVLGELFFEGKYVTRDYDRAFQYFELCKTSRSYIKPYYSGIMYLNGICVERDRGKAIECFESIVNADDPWKTKDKYYDLSREELGRLKGEVK